MKSITDYLKGKKFKSKEDYLNSKKSSKIVIVELQFDTFTFKVTKG